MPRYELRSQLFGLTDGQRRAASDCVLAAEPVPNVALEARKGQLFIVAEAAHTSVRERDACHQAIRTLRKAFYDNSSYSITTSLSKAIEKTNKLLYQQNFNTTAQKRAFVGVTCAVLKDQGLYVAQVQPTQMLLVAEGVLRALPTNPVWAGDAESAPLKPNALGASLTIEPTFARATLRPGDALIIGASGLAPYLRRAQADHLLRLDDPDAIAGELERLSAEYDLAQAYGIVLQILAAKAAPRAERAAPRSPSTGNNARTGSIAQMLWGRAGRERAERDQRRVLRHDHNAREQQQLQTLPEEPAPPPRDDLRVRPLDPSESLEQRTAQVRNERLTRLGGLPARPEAYDLTPSAFLGEGDYIEPQPEQRYDLGDTLPEETFTSYARRERGQAPDTNPTIGERLVEPWGRTMASLRTLGRSRKMRRRLPPTALPPRKKGAGLTYRKEGPSFPWIQLGLLVAIVALAMVYGYNLLESNSRQQEGEILTQARSAIEVLRNAPDEAAAQKLLAQAAVALDSVRATGAISTSQERQQEFLSLQREYEQVQAEVQRITYFDDIADLGAHPQANAGNSFTTLVVPPPPTSITNTVGFESIYALDSVLGIIYQLPKNGGTVTPLLTPEQQIEGNISVGRLKAIAWRIDNVAVVGQVEGGGYVYYFRDGANWRSSNLGGSNEWRRDASQLKFVTYRGNLYFWSALPGQVLKYTSGQPGDLYTPWINDYGGSDVESALDLAVDGSVYLLRPDGRIQVFDKNTFQKEIPAPQVEPSLTAVSGFVVTGDDPSQGAIYILDAANNRIVQIDKQTGAIVQQIRTRAGAPLRLDGLSTMAVDATGPQPLVYLVNHGHILRATIPQPPKPYVPAATRPVTPTVQP